MPLEDDVGAGLVKSRSLAHASTLASFAYPLSGPPEHKLAALEDAVQALREQVTRLAREIDESRGGVPEYEQPPSAHQGGVQIRSPSVGTSRLDRVVVQLSGKRTHVLTWDDREALLEWLRHV